MRVMRERALDKLIDDVIVKLISYDEEETMESARYFWDMWKEGINEEHHGDCTNEPNTCKRCLAELYYARAEELINLITGM